MYLFSDLYFGSLVWLCDRSGSGNLKVVRSKVREKSRDWVMGSFVCFVSEFEFFFNNNSDRSSI